VTAAATQIIMSDELHYVVPHSFIEFQERWIWKI